MVPVVTYNPLFLTPKSVLLIKPLRLPGHVHISLTPSILSLKIQSTRRPGFQRTTFEMKRSFLFSVFDAIGWSAGLEERMDVYRGSLDG